MRATRYVFANSMDAFVNSGHIPCCRPRGPLAALAFGSKWGNPCVFFNFYFRIYHEFSGWAWKEFGTWHIFVDPFPLLKCYTPQNHDLLVDSHIFDHIWNSLWGVYCPPTIFGDEVPGPNIGPFCLPLEAPRKCPRCDIGRAS